MFTIGDTVGDLFVAKFDMARHFTTFTGLTLK
jgi:hypothetical protein